MSIKKGTTTLTGNPINPCWGNLEGNIQDQVDLNNILTGLAPKDSAELTGRPTAPTPTAGLNNNQLATTAFVQNAISSSGGGLPSQAGNSGKFLTTNGTTAEWATVDALPSQSGNNGYILTTDGTDASWINPTSLTAISNKVDKVSTANKIYGTNGSGGQATFTLSNSNGNNTVAYRTSTGTLRVSDPTDNKDAV